MKKVLFGSGKNYYKGNMHCHSNLSDGLLTPEQLKKMYKSRGYSFLAITDHEYMNDNSELDDDGFITITSCEIAIKQYPEQSTLKNRGMKVCHLNLYAKEQHNPNHFYYSKVYDHFTGKSELYCRLINKEMNRIYGAEGINKIIKKANENGFFVAYNHPRWSLENYGDYAGYEGLWGVEIFNTSCNVGGLYEYDINVVDDFLRDGKRVYATSGVDNHNHKDDSFGTFVTVNTDALGYGSIIDALLKGDFYTSTGPEIYELSVENGRVFVKCSNAKAINITTAGRRAKSIKAEAGGYIGKAEFELLPEDGYFRITVVDEFGHRADSQSYFLDEIM